MPSLPFTFEDLRNLNVADTKAASDEIASSVDPTVANGRAAQGFLASRLNQLKDNMSTADGLIDVGMSINPGLRYVDMASRFFGGPSVADGFRAGVTQPVGDERSGRSEIVLPPMPF